MDRQPSPAAARPSVSVWFGKIEIMANRTRGRSRWAVTDLASRRRHRLMTLGQL
jgi:hypothetical protein